MASSAASLGATHYVHHRTYVLLACEVVPLKEGIGIDCTTCLAAQQLSQAHAKAQAHQASRGLSNCAHSILRAHGSCRACEVCRPCRVYICIGLTSLLGQAWVAPGFGLAIAIANASHHHLSGHQPRAWPWST